MANYNPNLSAEQRRLLSLVPMQARVKITRPNGTFRYVAVNQVTPVDRIETKPDGTPIIMQGLPGRPGKSAVNAIPVAQQSASAGFQTHQSKHQAIARDPLVRMAQTNPDAKQLADQLIQEVTEELAALKFDRHQAEQAGIRDTTQISTRRINSLMQLSSLWIKRFEANIGGNQVDLNSAGVQALILFITETFRDAMDQSGMPQSAVDGVLAKLVKMMDGNWRQEAEVRIKAINGG